MMRRIAFRELGWLAYLRLAGDLAFLAACLCIALRQFTAVAVFGGLTIVSYAAFTVMYRRRKKTATADTT